MGGEGVAEGVATYALGDARAECGSPDRALQDRFVEVMAAALVGQSAGVDAGCRKDPLPGPFSSGIGVLPREGARQFDPAGAGLQVELMLGAHCFDVPQEIGLDGSRQHRQAILVPFAGAYHDLIPAGIDVLHAQARALEEAQACAIEQERHEPQDPMDLAENGADLIAS